MDPEDKAGETVHKLGLAYPVGYGLNAEAVSELTGSFYNPDKGFLHAAGFLLRPDKNIEVAAYSSGPIGRLVAGDTLKLVRFYKGK